MVSWTEEEPDGTRGGTTTVVKGFRPGKEPPRLRKQQAKRQLGEVSAAQERLLEVFASRTPGESRALMRRWRISLFAVGAVLLVAGALLYGWSLLAGVVVHFLAAIALVIGWRLHRQREALGAMADLVGAKRGRSRR